MGINDSFGTWEITTEKIKFNERSGYYYFLCYLLYTPKEGKRDAEAMYGNVMMHGGQISAGRIKSLNGQTYIDLDTGEISGKITFLPNSPALTQVDNAIQSKMNGLGSLAWKNAVEKAQLGETIIQGGYIKTELLNASAIVSNGGGVTNTALQNAINGLVFGGRNLILNSGTPKSGYYWLIYPLANVDISGEHTLQIWLENTTPNGAGVGFGNANGYDGHYFDYPNLQNGVYTKTLNISKGNNTHLCIWANNQTTITKIKLEKGNRPTDWTPAPEDLEAQFQALQSGISNIQTSLGDIKTKTDNFTSIQGGLVSSNIISVGDTQVNQNAFISGVTDAGGLSVRFGAGANYANKNNAPFRVLDNGKMIAENADISGKINAESGKIGSFHINSGLMAYDLSEDSWANNNQYVRLSPEMFVMRKNGTNRGEHQREVRIGTTTSAASGWEGPVMRVENTMSPEFAFVQRDNVALYLNAKNANKDNIALDIASGDIRVGGEKGITGEVRIGTRKIRFKNGIAVETNSLI